MIKSKFWIPELTSQFTVCPVPYHLDTYRGCVFNCLYCFARAFQVFNRKNRNAEDESTFEYLEANRADLFSNWIKRTLDKEEDLSRSAEVAFRERIPLRIGSTADPFPPLETKEKITYSFLKVLEQYDYPLKIQTKNPGGLVKYSAEFDNPNWVIGVSLMSVDEKFIKACEPNCTTPKKRLSAIEKLTKENKKVMVKIQPAIFPKILEDLPALIKAVADSGAFAISIEGLKMRKMMPEREQDQYRIISSFLGYDLREAYKKENHTSSDYELRKHKKMRYVKMSEELCKEHKIQCYIADNNLGAYGCGLECCGTQELRDYKIFGKSSRSFFYGKQENESQKLAVCTDVSFLYDNGRKKIRGKTLSEIADKKNKRVYKNKFFDV